MSKQQLNEVLAKFYVEVRRQNGKPYSKGAYEGIRAGLQRYLTNEHQANFCLTSDPAFEKSNQKLNIIFEKISSTQGLERGKDRREKVGKSMIKERKKERKKEKRYRKKERKKEKRYRKRIKKEYEDVVKHHGPMGGNGRPHHHRL